MDDRELERKTQILLRAWKALDYTDHNPQCYKDRAERDRVFLGVAKKTVQTLSLTGQEFWDSLKDDEHS